MLTDKIVQLISDEKLTEAVEITNDILYAKLSAVLEDKYDELRPGMFEGKKRIKDTGKEDDGEGMDRVGSEDGDVDNDGDSDESDDYLKNRRKAVGKSIKKKKGDEDEDDVDEGKVPPQFLKKNGKDEDEDDKDDDDKDEDEDEDEDEDDVEESSKKKKVSYK